MKLLLILFGLLPLNALAMHLQVCATVPNTGGLMGCPDPNVIFTTPAPNMLVRSIVGGIQAWRPYSSLKTTDSVFGEDLQWHLLSTLTAVGSLPTMPVPPNQPTSSWQALNWSCSIANNVATCTAPISP